MKFVLMMHAPWGETGDWDIFQWPPNAIQEHMRFLGALNDELAKEGVLVGIDGLAPPNQARLVRASSNGGLPVTDGPFPESKDEIAGRASAAPGPDGTPLDMAIEVRQVMSGPPPKGG